VKDNAIGTGIGIEKDLLVGFIKPMLVLPENLAVPA